ncbi:hypothetical protein B0H14DRAFT_2583196 [Mycena olivaceomarginata]|nr:hypothetical protein B0H14DRAFT_2583196 [Mycena olivaceomarginata]
MCCGIEQARRPRSDLQSCHVLEHAVIGPDSMREDIKWLETHRQGLEGIEVGNISLVNGSGHRDDQSGPEESHSAAEVKFNCRQTAAAVSDCHTVTLSKCCHTTTACGRLLLKITRVPLQSANFAAAECCQLLLHNVCLCFGAAILLQTAAA